MGEFRSIGFKTKPEALAFILDYKIFPKLGLDGETKAQYLKRLSDFANDNMYIKEIEAKLKKLYDEKIDLVEIATNRMGAKQIVLSVKKVYGSHPVLLLVGDKTFTLNNQTAAKLVKAVDDRQMNEGFDAAVEEYFDSWTGLVRVEEIFGTIVKVINPPKAVLIGPKN